MRLSATSWGLARNPKGLLKPAGRQALGTAGADETRLASAPGKRDDPGSTGVSPALQTAANHSIFLNVAKIDASLILARRFVHQVQMSAVGDALYFLLRNAGMDQDRSQAA
jgi:hypothetical protein